MGQRVHHAEGFVPKYDGQEPVRASVPNPKFALLRSTRGANFGFDKDTSELMILVSFMVQKFARRTRGTDGANF